MGLLARSHHWSAKRCRRTTFLLALFLFLICGCVAQYAMHTIPYGWVAEAPWAQMFTQSLWFTAVLMAPLVAQKIASPATKLSDMRVW